MKNLPSKEYMIKKSKPWQPYRTVACWYLWRIVDDEIVW
jgi:3-methyladenine DNA glycosylase/8-oxoguanine DNA glycosylase